MAWLWKRRWFRLAGALALSVTVLPLCLCLFHHNVRTSKEDFQEITKGMTQNEVETLLGGPPGDYTNGRWRLNNHGSWSEHEIRKVWVSDGGRIAVYFDKYGAGVLRARYYRIHVEKLSPIKRLWYRLERIRAPEADW